MIEKMIFKAETVDRLIWSSALDEFVWFLTTWGSITRGRWNFLGLTSFREIRPNCAESIRLWKFVTYDSFFCPHQIKGHIGSRLFSSYLAIFHVVKLGKRHKSRTLLRVTHSQKYSPVDQYAVAAVLMLFLFCWFSLKSTKYIFLCPSSATLVRRSVGCFLVGQALVKITKSGAYSSK